MLRVTRLVSPVRFFDGRMLELATWMSERYVAPLATVLGSISPPRVAGEEARRVAPAGTPPGPPRAAPVLVLTDYARGDVLRDAIGRGGAFVVRPAPEDEQRLAVEAVATSLSVGRAAIVLVPEAEPLPATAAAVRDAFGSRVAMFLGGDERARYRRWLELRDGRFDVVVGTRPAVFAPLADLGLVYVARESHPAHRQERAPYYHVRDVALARARIEGATCVLAAACPSSEAAALGLPDVAPRTRRWPKVEVVRPGPEGRAPRLREALAHARRAFVYVPLKGAGVARVCRNCGATAACASCGGTIRLAAGELRCAVCGSPGRCGVCGAADFGIRRGGAEHVERWVRGIAPVPVARPAAPRLPDPSGEIVIGGAEHVRDLGPAELDVVAILDADRTLARPGLGARERALAIWMEAIAWAAPSGRAIVQTDGPADPAVQALVRGNPDRFHQRERERRAEVGFPVGVPVFRVVGDHRLESEVRGIRTRTSLVSALGRRTVCLLALEPDELPLFGASMRELAARGVVERVEAEPHL